MALIRKFSFLSCVLVQILALGSCQYRQRSTLYSQRGARGDYIALDAVYEPHLGARNWNNRAYSTCVTGVWLFYDYANFNFGVDAAMEYVVGLGNHCADFTSAIAGKATSVRFAGYQFDYRSDTLTLYENVYFQGDEEYLTQDSRSLKLDRLSKSLIITGRSAWTIYDQPDFRGNSICVYPPRNAPEFSPALIYDTAKLINAPHNTIRSVRRGCSGKSVVMATALASSGNFTLQFSQPEMLGATMAATATLGVLQAVNTLASLLTPITEVHLGNGTSRRQRATLYFNQGGLGNSTRLGPLEEPDFQQSHNGVKALSANVTGVWLFYSDRFYGSIRPIDHPFHAYSSVEYVYGNGSGRVINFDTDSVLRSARYAGISTDYWQPTITFYKHLHFQGKETVYVEDTTNSVYLPAKSLIITGSSPWTVSTGDMFSKTTDTVCINPPVHTDHPPAFLKRLTGILDTFYIRSVRKGCFSTKVYNSSYIIQGHYRSPWPDLKDVMGTKQVSANLMAVKPNMTLSKTLAHLLEITIGRFATNLGIVG